jgi:hypothetical protein
MVAEFGGNAGGGRAPADHRIGVRLRQHRTRQLAGAATDRAEERPFRIIAQEFLGRLIIGPLRVRITDVSREEFEEA